MQILLGVLILFLELALCCLFVFLNRHMKKMADIVNERHLAYENEKGKNLATKEDVQEITRKVEEVKSVVSLANQKKYEQLAEQERILLEILDDANKVSKAQNKLVVYLYDISSRQRYDALVEFVNDTTTHFYHLCNLALVSVPAANVDKEIEDLSVAVSFLAININVLATNAASLVSEYNNKMEYAFNQTETDQQKATWLAGSLRIKQQIEEMRGKPVPGKEKIDEAIQQYCAWLKQLYGKNFFTFKS